MRSGQEFEQVRHEENPGRSQWEAPQPALANGPVHVTRAPTSSSIIDLPLRFPPQTPLKGVTSVTRQNASGYAPIGGLWACPVQGTRSILDSDAPRLLDQLVALIALPLDACISTHSRPHRPLPSSFEGPMANMTPSAAKHPSPWIPSRLLPTRYAHVHGLRHVQALLRYP